MNKLNVHLFAIVGVRLTPLVMCFACGAVDIPSMGVLPDKDNSSDVTQPGTGSGESSFDLTKCGFDTGKPGANISSRQMAIVPLKKTVTTKILGGIFTSQTDVVINGAFISEDSLTRSIESFTSQSAPTVESDEVASITSKLSLSYVADLMPLSERAVIGETFSDWKGLFCSFQPAIKIERGTTQKVVAEFDKPLPLAPLVVAGLPRLTEEIGAKRSWKGITAKVVESNDPTAPIGTVYSGTVTSEPVNPVIAVDSTNGKLTIQAELAVKMIYNFGSEASNKALGLPSSVVWYIDSQTKTYKLMQVDLGGGVLVNYFPK